MIRIFKVFIITAISIITTFAIAAVPGLISYHGVLVDSSDLPVNDKVVITFTIYDDTTAGNPLWTETQNVQVRNGAFDVRLGDINPLNSNVFTTDNLYLGIQVEGDEEMTPRKPVTTKPYTFNAQETR